LGKEGGSVDQGGTKSTSWGGGKGEFPTENGYLPGADTALRAGLISGEKEGVTTCAIGEAPRKRGGRKYEKKKTPRERIRGGVKSGPERSRKQKAPAKKGIEESGCQCLNQVKGHETGWLDCEKPGATKRDRRSKPEPPISEKKRRRASGYKNLEHGNEKKPRLKRSTPEGGRAGKKVHRRERGASLDQNAPT